MYVCLSWVGLSNKTLNKIRLVLGSDPEDDLQDDPEWSGGLPGEFSGMAQNCLEWSRISRNGLEFSLLLSKTFEIFKISINIPWGELCEEIRYLAEKHRVAWNGKLFVETTWIDRILSSCLYPILGFYANIWNGPGMSESKIKIYSTSTNKTISTNTAVVVLPVQPD